MNNDTFEQISVLQAKLVDLMYQYEENKSALAYLYTDIDPEERNAIEESIPFLEKQIETIKQKIEEITILS